jgi:hypothetical protein
MFRSPFCKFNFLVNFFLINWTYAATGTAAPRCDNYEYSVLRGVENMLIALNSMHNEYIGSLENNKYTGSRVREFFDGQIEKVLLKIYIIIGNKLFA